MPGVKLSNVTMLADAVEQAAAIPIANARFTSFFMFLPFII
jgi:hypothetical protein